MPNVPERQPSLGETLFKMRRLDKSDYLSKGTKDFAEVTIEDSTPTSKNGPIRTTKLPHPFKCSACLYVGMNKRDVDRHWSEEH